MIGWRDILLGVLLPAAVTATIVLAGVPLGRWWRLRRALVPIGVAAGFIAGYAALLRVPGFPPLDSTHWLFYAAAGAGALGAIDALLWRPRAGGERDIPLASPAHDAPLSPLDYANAARTSAGEGWIARTARFLVVLLFAGVFVWLLARPLLVFHWTGADGTIWIASIALIMAIVWLALDALAERTTRCGGGLWLAVALALVAGVSSLTIMLSGSQKLGQMGGMLTASLLAAAGFACFQPEARVWRGMVLVYAVLHTALVASAAEHLYASLTTLHALLLVVSAPLAWAGELLPPRQARARALLRVVAALSPAGLAAVLAGIAFARASGPSPDLAF